MTLSAMATKITKDNYYLAAAILGSAWAHSYPEEQAVGLYLVINNEETDPFFKKHSYPEYKNSWLYKDGFFTIYKFVDQEVPNEFAPVATI